MSDESDSSDAESVVVHKHPWRSESKSKLIKHALFSLTSDSTIMQN